MRKVMQYYIANIGSPDLEFAAQYMAAHRAGEDPVETRPVSFGGASGDPRSPFDHSTPFSLWSRVHDSRAFVLPPVGNRLVRCCRWW